MIEIDIPDLEKIQREIRKLAGKEANKVARTATRKMAIVARKEMKARAPVDTGYIRKEIRMSVRKSKKHPGFYARVGYLGNRYRKDWHYALYLEKGASGHRIPNEFMGGGRYGAKTKNTVAKRPSFGGNVYSVVDHPGIEPRPYIKPAFMSKRQEMIRVGSRTFIDEIRKRWK